MEKRTSAALLVLATIVALAHVASATLIRQTIADAVSKKARCMDGSSAIYYLYRNVSSTKWIVHFQGGGFCTSKAECLDRANSSRGSSNGWACALPQQMVQANRDAAATVSSDSRRNPQFRYWNRVFVPYCSGDLWIGAACNKPVNPYGVWFCGHQIFEAVIDELLMQKGMNESTDVILGGSSAGGLGIMMNLEDNAVKVKAATRTKRGAASFVGGYVDGWTRFYPSLPEYLADPNAMPESSPFIAQIVTLARFVFNAYVPTSCSNVYPTSAAPLYGLQCADPRWGLRTITSAPVILLAARWDTYNIFLGIGQARYACASTNMTLEVIEDNYVQKFGEYGYMHARTLSQQTATANASTSIFFTNCFTHTFIGEEDVCSGVNGTSAYQALVSFSTSAKMGRPVTYISSPPSPANSLMCNTHCGATQCDWGTNQALASRGSCGTLASTQWEPYRYGELCPGTMRSDYAVADTFNGDMILYHVVNATRRNAVCLDESPAAYLVARNTSSRNWIIHMRGGGYCNSPADCHKRATTRDGSSKEYACTLPGRETAAGYVETIAMPINPDPSLNPDYHTWNRVFLRYCSGDVFLGRRIKAQSHFGVSTVGHYCFVSTMEDLLNFHGMNRATTVVLGGASAGAISATAHIDLVNTMVNAATNGNTKVVGYSDGGWFRAYPSEGDVANNQSWTNWPQSTFVNNIRQLFGLVFNAYYSPACIQGRSAVLPLLGGQECLDARYAYPYLKTPSIMLGSMWDSYDLFLKFGSKAYVCAVASGALTLAQQSYARMYAELSYRDMQFFRSNVTAIFAPVCYKHTSFWVGRDTPTGPVVSGPPCGRLDGLTPYQALSRFVHAVRQGKTDLGSMSKIGVPVNNNSLGCAPGCGARQCSWSTKLVGNPWLSYNGTCPGYLSGTSFGSYSGSSGVMTCNTNVQSGIFTTATTGVPTTATIGIPTTATIGIPTTAGDSAAGYVHANAASRTVLALVATLSVILMSQFIH